MQNAINISHSNLEMRKIWERIPNDPIALEEWSVLCSVRLQEPLQVVRVGLNFGSV